MSLGNNIKLKRKNLNMTQVELAENICTQSQISKIEKDEIIPMADLLYNISKKLKTTSDELFGEEPSYIEYKINKMRFEELLLKYDFESLEGELARLERDQLNLDDKVYYDYISLITKKELYNEDAYGLLESLYKTYEENISLEMKVELMNGLGVMAIDRSEFEKGFIFLEKAYNLVFLRKMDSRLTLKVLYNYLRMLLEKKDYRQLHITAIEAINFAFRKDNYQYIAEFIYFKNLALESMGISELIDHEEIIYAKVMAKNQKKFEVLKRIEKLWR